MTAKVVNKENNKQPIVSKGKQLMKTECVIADHTNTIALTLWEDLIDAVDCGKTYKFYKLQIIIIVILIVRNRIDCLIN